MSTSSSGRIPRGEQRRLLKLTVTAACLGAFWSMQAMGKTWTCINGFWDLASSRSPCGQPGSTRHVATYNDYWITIDDLNGSTLANRVAVSYNRTLAINHGGQLSIANRRELNDGWAVTGRAEQKTRSLTDSQSALDSREDR